MCLSVCHCGNVYWTLFSMHLELWPLLMTLLSSNVMNVRQKGTVLLKMNTINQRSVNENISIYLLIAMIKQISQHISWHSVDWRHFEGILRKPLSCWLASVMSSYSSQDLDIWWLNQMYHYLYPINNLYI